MNFNIELLIIVLLVLLTGFQQYRIIKNKKERLPAEYIKSIYGIFITIMDEYKEYFIKYELGRYTFIKNNEIVLEEYNNLVRSYVTKFFERYGDSTAVNDVIQLKYSNKEAFIQYLINDFDILLFDKQILSKSNINEIYKTRNT